MGYSSKFCRRLNGVKPALVMVVVQIVFAGMNVFYKLAMNDGMNMMILVAYRSLFATAFVLPLAFFFERKIIPKLTWTIVFQAFLCGLFGNTLAQNFYVASMHLTSASFTAAMANLIPAMTFIMAILCGFEVLGFGNVAGKAKVLGTLIGISGAMLLTFYKGVEIPMWSTHALHIHHDDHGGQVSTSGKRVLGSLLAVGSCLCYATWLMVQTKMSEKIQCYYSSTALMCGMGSIQAVGFALCMERDWTQWQLGWNIRLLASAYSGILASGLMVTLIAWCVHERGALFVSVFNPLMLVLVAIAGSILLDEKLHLGSVLGAILIVIGLYFVLWGKAKELKNMSKLVTSKSSRKSEIIQVIVTSSANETTVGNSNTVMTRSIIPSDEIQQSMGENSNNTTNSSSNTNDRLEVNPSIITIAC
ncbi:hypothetical protein C5167_009743 [Papaver somniferum]|uniref:EamA domain-containing protein n=2 Tax=Papaver somniferum TaxID=3469 RepID=A0A4Y7JZR2_PAPSO|nr:WAT1-related protein At1g25270-like isoform X1 [Papaver somniferum]RZC66056.1 hypothetical protein C5167_009743 [Papaver somniferum]